MSTRERKPTVMTWIERAIILFIVVCAVLVAVIIWVISHFISKYW